MALAIPNLPENPFPQVESDCIAQRQNGKSPLRPRETRILEWAIDPGVATRSRRQPSVHWHESDAARRESQAALEDRRDLVIRRAGVAMAASGVALSGGSSGMS